MSETEPRFHGEVTERSHKNMSRIKGKDTSIELILRKALWAKGYRFRKNCKELPGRPDIAITKHKIAIFCDSEFFHGKDWDNLQNKISKGKNADYWVNKIERNIQRDHEKDVLLRFQGWTVIHFWGKDIIKDVNSCITAIEEVIRDNKSNEVFDE
ncbi:MAG: very short patch repair endonuclease [Lachnospiraceae bacterium]|nr:very short patch repair endonuclease [Lachnospiraceae bacterium]